MATAPSRVPRPSLPSIQPRRLAVCPRRGFESRQQNRSCHSYEYEHGERLSHDHPNLAQQWRRHLQQRQATTTTNPADTTVEITTLFLATSTETASRTSPSSMISLVQPPFRSSMATAPGTWVRRIHTDPNSYSSGPFHRGSRSEQRWTQRSHRPALSPPDVWRHSASRSCALFIGNANRTMTYGTIATTQCPAGVSRHFQRSPTSMATA